MVLDTSQRSRITQDIRKRLAIVIDPEMGRNVIEMGLIYRVDVMPDGLVEIAMTTTVEGCPAASLLTQGVQAAAAEASGVKEVKVHLTYEPRWEPRMMAS